ncbi:TetR family transcriptional regulator [Verrucomicrobia bacterium]|nr:TetR family transcriptional regulator [Verrucomicrobiota bacterium]
MSDTDTKTAILDAAEALFVEHGFEGASMRSVVSLAKVNVAAAHYHFGSREALVEAVLTRRLEPINQRRLDNLNMLEVHGGALDLEEILRALFAPAVSTICGAESAQRNVARLIGRMFSEPSAPLQAFLKHRFQEVFDRYSTALRRILPTLPDDDFYWRIHFMLGALCQTLCDQERPGLLSGGIIDGHSSEDALEQLVAFVAGGLRASSSKQVNKRHP